MKLTKKQKKSLFKIIAAGVFFAAGVVTKHLFGLDFSGFKPVMLAPVCLFAAAYLLVGLEVLIHAVMGVFHGELLDENFLMAVATIGAFALGDLSEGVAVMLFYQVGELFQNIAVSRSRKSITSLVGLRADHAEVERDGKVLTVDPNEVAVGEVIVVRPGEKIPLDAVVVEGTTSLDTSALTGESLPREISVGDAALAGCVNREGLFRARVTKTAGESTAAKILDLVENASSKKSRYENFITRFARIYTPCVVAAAVLISIVPPLVTGWSLESFSKWLTQGLSFLVISCPCALVISVPLAFFGGIGGASKRGILVKGGNYLEALADVSGVVFDKTGTLTKGSFRVTETRPENVDEKTLITLAAKAEASSSHPIAKSIVEAYHEMTGSDPDTSDISDLREIAGHGVECLIGGRKISVGNRRMMASLGLEVPEFGGTVVYAAESGQNGENAAENHQNSANAAESCQNGAGGAKYLGSIVIADEPKPTSKAAIEALRTVGVRDIVMLTGDSPKAAEKAAAEIGVSDVRAGLLPDGKINELEKLIENKPAKTTIAFVGDGINDAPVISRADVGIAMGGIGSDAAIEAADIVLMDDDPAKVAEAIKLARKVVRVSRENVIFALGVKAAIMLIGLFGLMNMWLAVFADVGVAILAILNSMRTMRK